MGNRSISQAFATFMKFNELVRNSFFNNDLNHNTGSGDGIDKIT